MQTPKKDLVGRAAIYHVKDKEWDWREQVIYSEPCTICDVDENSGVVSLSFTMFDKDYVKPIKDVEVGLRTSCSVESALPERRAL